MHIRPETIHDLPAIAQLHMRAFGERLAEALIVTIGRQRAAYDPELSLVAEVEGKIAGHALFLPYTIRLMGTDVQAVNLAPIGVDPAFQKQGIGGALLREGHRIAAAKGYALSFLLGHVEYYPRFGYRTGAYGVSSIDVPTDSPPDHPLAVRAPTEADLPALLALWEAEESGVDFAIRPSASLLDWLSPDPRVTAHVYLQDEVIVGCTRISQTAPDKPRFFLARDAQTARAISAQIGAGFPQITLPLHPYSASAAAFGTPQVSRWNAGMACALASGVLDAYFAQVESGTRAAGRVLWPTIFDVE